MDEFEKRLYDEIESERKQAKKDAKEADEHWRRADALRKAAKEAHDQGNDDLAQSAETDAHVQHQQGVTARDKANSEYDKIFGKWKALWIYQDLQKEKETKGDDKDKDKKDKDKKDKDKK